MNNTVNTTVEILGKFYPVRCSEAEVKSLQEAARFLDQQMTEIKESGKVINLERIAIIAALNIAHQFLQISKQKTNHLDNINTHIKKMHDKVEAAIKKTTQTEFTYVPD